MIEQFNDFMVALDNQIKDVNKRITELEDKRAKLNKAREQFVNASMLIREDEPTVETNEEVHEEEAPIIDVPTAEEKVEVKPEVPAIPEVDLEMLEKDIMTPQVDMAEDKPKNIYVAPDGSIWDSEEEYIIAQIAGQ